MPKNFATCSIQVGIHDHIKEKQRMKCGIKQIPVVSSDAITGQKLQGLTKDNLLFILGERRLNGYMWSSLVSGLLAVSIYFGL